MRRIALAPALLLLVGCSSFPRDWKRGLRADPTPISAIEGYWEGTWESDVNGHRGVLRAIITHEGGDRYHARFRATYRKLLRFGMAVPLTAEQHGDVSTFQGQADLGWLAGGIYHYDGHATFQDFEATYSCKRDHGTFRMTRRLSGAGVR